MTAVTPTSDDTYLLLTALRPISHHDAAAARDSNTLLFNREAKLLPLPSNQARPPQQMIDMFCRTHQAAPETAAILADLPFPDFVACALVRLFLDIYNSQDGTGLFEGKERYTRLESRLRNAATRAYSLRGLWDCLTRDLEMPIHPSERDAQILLFAHRAR